MTTKLNTQVKKSYDAFVNALNARIESAENDNQAKNLRAELKFVSLPVIQYAIENGVNIQELSQVIAITDKKHNDFLAVYALQKVRKALTACAQGITRSFDPYTRTILANLCASEQNTKTAYVSLSRSIEFNEFDTQKTIKARYNCAVGTAGTQASSTRQALRVLNIASVTKGRVNDEFALTDSALANKVKSMFA